MRSVFIDVDTQHDFCDPHGALFVGGADALAPAWRALTASAITRGVPVVASVDSHAFDAWEFAGSVTAGPNGERPGFPPHCVKGTAGWLKLDGTLAPRARFVPNVPLTPDLLATHVLAHEPQQILLEKEVYSLFANPNAAEALAMLLEGEHARFVVYGVATDYCVRAAALGLFDFVSRANGGEVWLVRDAIAAVVPHAGESAIEECRARGVRIVTTADALRP